MRQRAELTSILFGVVVAARIQTQKVVVTHVTWDLANQTKLPSVDLEWEWTIPATKSDSLHVHVSSAVYWP